jgi:predicted RNA-binding Zn ribbon-like protein
MKTQATHGPHFIANNLALDFINSAFGLGESSYDWLADDASAVAWLKAANQLEPEFDEPAVGLAVHARLLREAGGRLIDASTPTLPGDLEVVNQILEAGHPIRKLAPDANAQFVLEEQRRDNNVASLLESIATAFVHLLTEGDLTQVHQCEAHDCTLRFLDANKSRRRRWCSMAVCGNRMKVAAFRARTALSGHGTGIPNPR